MRLTTPSRRPPAPPARPCARRRHPSAPRATTAPPAAPPAAPLLLSPRAPPPGTERPWPRDPAIVEGTWLWTPPRAAGAPQLAVRYTRAAANDDLDPAAAPPLVLVHGFGGNADHWRANVPDLAARHGLRVWAVDLIGYGFSSKPDPATFPGGSPYTFATWGDQVAAFIDQVVGEPAFLSTNSVGGIAALAAATEHTASVRGVQLMDVSLRMLHTSKMSPLQKPVIGAVQRVLRETPIGRAFFGSVATPATVASILKQAYGNPDTVTPALVDAILTPGLEPGAAAVFLDFISYSGGPLAEDLLKHPALAAGAVPVSVLWGEADPWERLEWGRALFTPAACPGVVEEFVPLPGLGHCPHDEAPGVVDPLIARFVRRHS